MKLKTKHLKLRVSRDTRKKVYLSIAIFSMVLNSFYPFFASYQYVYAEGEAVVEESASASESAGASEEETTSEEPVADTSSEESTSTEETTIEEPTVTESAVTGENTTEENTTDLAGEVLGISTENTEEIQPTETTGTEGVAETQPAVDENQLPDILPDGVGDYRPEATSEPSTEIIPITDTTDAIDPVVETIEEMIPSEIEKECLADGVEIIDSVADDWVVDSEKGYAETKENVKLGVKYIFPVEEGVTLTFSCLPKNEDDRSVLRIQQVKVSDLNLPDEFQTDAEYAYDITTDMTDGTFELDLTLPKPEGVEAGVVYVEGSLEDLVSKELMSEDVVEIGLEDINQDKEKGEVVVQDLNHLTTFWVSSVAGAPDLCPMTGAIWTTDNTCTTTNQNLYFSKSEVYLNGGPAGKGGPGIPDGYYYVRVTDPSGKDILGESETAVIQVVGGVFSSCYQLQNIVSYDDGGGSVPGFKDTTNPGGEYKVWVSPDGDFEDCSKTDNFKILKGGVCGDGNVNAQGEQCDDGNTNNNDYCNNECQFNSVCLPDVNMLVNGDFETPEVTNAHKWDIFNMYSPMLGWGVEWSGGSDIYNSETRPEPAFLELHRGFNGWLPKTGNQYAELDTDWDGPGEPLNNEPATVRISQDIPVLDGYKYRVDFSYSPRPGQGATNNNMDFELDGSPIENYSGSGGSNTNWTPEFYEFTADADAIRTVSFVEKGTADSLGMFLDDVKVTCLGPEEPECEEGPGWVDIVVSSKQGTLYNDDPITDPIRINPYETLGAADGDFFSLGKGGEIVLEFTSFLVNGVGDDISIHEITWNREGDIEEKAKVYVSADNSTWMYLGEASSFSDGDEDTIKDGVTYFDLDDLAEKPIWIRYVKLVESSEGQAGDDDGFDLDAVDEVYGVCEEPQPQCGNQRKEPGEECDGTDGVEEGVNFCTSTCKLVPIYDGQHTCSDGTAPVKIGSTYSLGAKDSDGVLVPLIGGQEYLFKVSGVYNFGTPTNRVADAAYGSEDSWATTRSDLGIWGTSIRGVLSVLGNLGNGVGVIEWDDDKAFNSDHVYQKAFTPKDNMSAQFLISDWYSTWYENSCKNQNCMSDNSGGLELEVYECRPASDVTVCKVDEQENNLPGWRVALLGESVDSFSVESDGTPVTKNYPVGSYVVEASGIYNYGSSVMNADAANSYRHAGLVCSGGVDGWVNGDASGCMNHYLNLNPSLSVGPTEAGWGDFFNPANIYYKAFGGGDLNLKIWDSCGTSGEGCYGDNEGNLDVTVYEGYAGDTGEDGCVTFSDVPYGIYGVVEAMQDGWANVSGLGKVDIDEPSGTITIVNRLLPTNGDLTICKYNDLNRNGEIDDNEPKIGWDMTVVDVDGGDAGETWNMATPAGDCLVLENMDLGSYEITEDQVAGWTKTFPSDSYTQTVTLDVNNPDATVNFLNYETPEVTIVATKIVCDYESDLPNYGEVGGSDITATTAADFLSTHPNCHLEEGWNFQWGDKYDTNPGDDKIGPATGWTTFGPTNTSGVATVTIGDVDTINKPLKIREELKAGYIPFTYTTSGKQNTNSVSAELYCGTDVFNYDNEEWISSLQYGQTYYCVAWNVVNDAYIQGIKFRDVNGNGVFDGTDRNIANRLDDWTIALFDKDWTLIRSADTGKDTPGNDVSKGQYRFKGLMAGKYYVCEQPETGWKQTVPALGSGVVEHNGSLCYEIDLLPGQEKIEVRFGNFELGVIQGVKFNDKDGDGEPRELDEEYMDGWKVRLYENWANPIEVTTPNTAQQGQYRFEGLEPGTYQLCEVNKGGWVQTWPSAGDVPVADNGVLHPEYGIAVINSSGAEDEAEVCWQTVISASGQEKILLRFGNAKLGDIHGYKWDDVNGDEEFNNEESKLSGWEIFIDEDDNSTWDSGEPKTTTSSDPDPMHFGWYKFEGLMPGTYTVCEVVQNGWTQTFPVGGCHDVTLPYSEVELKKAEPNAISEPAPAYNFGNYYNPSLTLAKWNNVGGNMSPGDTVEFTIQVTAHGNAVNNVIVTDLFSAGFGYVDDSWSGTLTEPTYASPGVWDLGNMEKDEVRLLTYSTVISDDIDPGIYKDLAWVAGEDLLGGGVLGTSEEEGYVAENFVGTDVPVVVDTQDPEVETEVDEEEVEEEVLGTSTVRLPATGANSWVLGSVLAIMVIGISLLAVSKRKKFVAIFFGLLLFGILGGSKVYADSSLMIRVEDLESFYNKPFGVTFVAMDLDSEGERPLTAICKKDGPNDAGWVVFETLPLALGGGTDVCNVESGDLNGNGDYDFMVTLVAGEGEGEESLDSNVVSTTFDNEGPDKPKYIEVDRKSDCKYEIELKTANDGQTSYVEVYMSDEKEFTAGPGSRIRTIGIGPDEKHEFTEEVAGEKCAHRQYFAVRAFDTAGNGSDVEAEELVDVNYITVYEEGTEETIQEAYAGGAASAIGGEGTGTGGEEVILPGEEGAEGEEGSILGEQTQEEEGAVQKGFFGKLISNPWTWIVLILGLGAITINGIKKSKQE